jgi:nicotinamidase-related amidase
MAIKPAIDPARTAVLSMDMQTAIVSIYATEPDAFTTRAAEVLRHCRERGITTIHVQVGFRPGLPEVSPRNALFAAVKNSPEHQKLFQGDAGKIHPALAPVGEDIVITKHRISAFTGTDLDMILRAKEIDTLVLFGIATSGVVLSTLLDAVDADYRTIVITDCCADRDPEVHTVLVEKFFPLRGTVVTAAAFAEGLPA